MTIPSIRKFKLWETCPFSNRIGGEVDWGGEQGGVCGRDWKEKTEEKLGLGCKINKQTNLFKKKEKFKLKLWSSMINSDLNI